MRRKVLYIATTLDGYIADMNDGFSFLTPYDGLESVTQSYHNLLSRIDTIIMGRKTYDVIQDMGVWPYQNIDAYIITNQPKEDQKNIFFRSNLKGLLEDLDQIPGKDIWIEGGGLLIQSLLELDAIDEFQIAIVPKLLGSGKRLFPSGNYDIDLKLVSHEILDGLMMLTYVKK